MHAVGIDVHAQDGCTASDVQHHLVFEDVLVIVDGITVGLRADLIFLLHCQRTGRSIDVPTGKENQPTFPHGSLKGGFVSGLRVYIEHRWTDHGGCSCCMLAQFSRIPIWEDLIITC